MKRLSKCDIMMVKSVDDKYLVHTHAGEIRTYTIYSLPMTVANWMLKRTMTYDDKGYCCWL